jgi:hypothetical protein
MQSRVKKRLDAAEELNLSRFRRLQAEADLLRLKADLKDQK